MMTLKTLVVKPAIECERWKGGVFDHFWWATNSDFEYFKLSSWVAPHCPQTFVDIHTKMRYAGMCPIAEVQKRMSPWRRRMCETTNCAHVLLIFDRIEGEENHGRTTTHLTSLWYINSFIVRATNNIQHVLKYKKGRHTRKELFMWNCIEKIVGNKTCFEEQRNRKLPTFDTYMQDLLYVLSF